MPILNRGDPVVGFPAVAASDARARILGTAPSVLSLWAGKYYAHPRNAFWRIMETLFAESLGLDYAARTSVLLQSKVALWDVLRSTERPGRLDSSIVAKTVVVNDFTAFFEQHPGMRARKWRSHSVTLRMALSSERIRHETFKGQATLNETVQCSIRQEETT